MAEEIEEFLVNKFSNGIILGDGTSRVVLDSQFTELKNWLTPIVNSTTLPVEEMKKLRNTLYELNNLLSECRLLSTSTRKIYSIEHWFPYKLSPISEKIKELRGPIVNVAAVAAEASNHEITSSSSSHPNGVHVASTSLAKKVEYFRKKTTGLSVDDTSKLKLYGLGDGLISVERMLFLGRREQGGEDWLFKGIGIVGTSGIGKTTLAQLLFNTKRVQDYFLPRIWVCMSKQPKDHKDQRVEVVKRMLMSLGVDQDEINQSVDKEDGLERLLYALRLQLKGKRYLIVLDDAWNIDNGDTEPPKWKLGWYENLGYSFDKSIIKDTWGNKLAHGLPKGNGGTVIVTTRDDELAAKMVENDNNNIYRVLPLSDPGSCWSIFKDQLPEDVTEVRPGKLEEDIKKMCAGLPLAAKVMGEIMNQEINKKQAALETNQVNNQAF